uniref:Uncharacterized protein n=1 Tax=Melanopsichium pennsylvanicum 4 TaxID=1398559 RepID=A0A077QUK6_9BASI|nr:uncharacterized protein BN887_06124 [Melanopsichium pennsylvanicum 4]
MAGLVGAGWWEVDEEGTGDERRTRSFKQGPNDMWPAEIA